MIPALLVVLLISVYSIEVAADDIRTALTVKQLNELGAISAPVAMQSFSAKGKNIPLTTSFQGRFTLSPNVKFSNLVLTAETKVYQFEKRTRPDAFTDYRNTLPKIDFEFIQSNDQIVPVKRGLQLTEHPHWDYFIGIGKIWQEIDDEKLSRISLPFSLIEKNQNCVHNGVVSFLMNDKGKPSYFYYQISSETCLYYKVDMWGQGTVEFQASNLDNVETYIKAYNTEQRELILNQPLTALKKYRPTLDLSKVALSENIKKTDMTNFGVIFQGEHFSSQCYTRHGDYPFCSQLILPSYSTAKSIFAGLSMLHLAKEFPLIFDEKVQNWLPECHGEQWRGVTFGHLLNMSTGNYHSLGHSVDEAAEHSQHFFKADTHQEKVTYGCQQFQKKSPVGEKFVYHSSDSYLLGTALNAFINKGLNQDNTFKQGPLLDVFEEVFLKKLWPLLNLSSTAYSTRRTSDKTKQPFTGYGLFFTRADIVKLSQFMMKEQMLTSNFLHQEKLNETLYRNKAPADMHSNYPFIHYINGFWKRNVTALLECKKETWLPYMLGYGGISIVLASNNLQYYYFSDSDHYLWSDAIKELNKFSPLCRQ